MKKSLITAGCFFLLAAISLPVSVCYVNQGKEEIVITQEVIEGDPEAASGIVLQMENTWNNHLFWETEYVIGNGSPAKSRFTFYAGRLRYNDVTESARLRNSLTYFYGPGYGAYGLNPDAVAVPEAVREMVRQTGPREAVVTVLSVRDLYEYWPVSVELSSDSHGFSAFQEYGMSEFFQIPVPENATAEITIQKDSDDRCTQLQCNAESGTINIKSAGAFGTEGCYLAYYCVDAQSGDLTPPGEDYGIYYVPYQQGPERIRKVFSLEKDCMPIALKTGEEAGQLWILILQGGRYYLNLLDLNEDGDCRLIQQITVLDTGMEKAESSLACITLTREGLLLTWQEDGLFAFISKDSEERYALWCVDHFPGEKEPAGNSLFPYEQVFLFDGERLALAAFPNWLSNDVQLAVFTKEGLAYYGLYRHSGEQDRENDIPGGRIHPAGVIDSGEIRRADNPLRLRFL